MPSQKNQHYVPRCALRPFSLDTEGRAINTYILAKQRPVQNAPLKSQCSQDYFYGKDLKAEKALGNLEGHYAQVLSLLTQGNNLSAADEDWLLFLRYFKPEELNVQWRRSQHFRAV
jgi:hypothetical protein